MTLAEKKRGAHCRLVLGQLNSIQSIRARGPMSKLNASGHDL